MLVSAVAVYLLHQPSPAVKSVLTPPPKDSFDCRENECVYYRVKDSLFPLKQPTRNSCWATVLTMLLSWKEAKELTIEEVVKRFGGKYEQLYKDSETKGIAIDDEIALYEQAGLGIMRQLNPSIDGWAYYLEEYGPLSVTIDARPPYGGTIHAILVTGIYGKKDGSKTKISYIDPLTGKEQLQDFMGFMKMYEAKYSVDWKIQIIHNEKIQNGNSRTFNKTAPELIARNLLII
ncbi:MAG TPA: papain-like cysteine protease family protein [Flavisolibacter sp.]|jgi:hypothetical protein|nr:papain-like cysteine protease family protein [Flavisolibacter sp.]